MTAPLILLNGVDQNGGGDSHTLEGYRRLGGYETAPQVLKTRKPEEVIEIAKQSGIRGRGGAGFSAGMKWSFVPKTEGPKYLLCNADEGEPGTFKDRVVLNHKPHQIIEGMIIAGFAIGANQGYVYIRGEFVKEADIVAAAIREAYAAGYLGKNVFGAGFDFDLHLYRGAGAYICGEETSLINSLEGKRGYPRLKPPFPAVSGYDAKPTVVNNVETLAAIPWIMKNGGETYATFGTPKSTGTRLFSISGHVNKPGVYEVELGTPLMSLVNDFAGGMLDGRKLKAIIPGGSSVPILTAEECQDVLLDFESMAAKGTMLGSGAVIVMAEGTCIVRSLMVLTRFYAHESCGQCTPCREGTPWLAKVLKSLESGTGSMKDLELLEYVCKAMVGNTICPLADAAAMPTRSYIQKFREEFTAHIEGKGCPYPQWPLK